MLAPEYLADLPQPILDLYAQAEAEILADMARRISTYDYWIPSADWQNRKLREAGAVQEEILDILSRYTGRSTEELEALIRQAAEETLKSDGEVYQAAGRYVPTLADSQPLRSILNAGYKATAQTMKNLTRTTANTASKQFEDALDVAWLKVQSGAFSTDTAVRDGVKSLAKQGVGSIRYPSGHTDSLEVAVRRAVVTGVNQTCAQLQGELADELGCDLVEVTAHAGARPSHQVWQGQVFSRSGKSDKYPDFVSSTGYGTGAGLCGWNCRHSFHPYMEGSPRTWTEERLKALNDPKYKYNDRELTEYEASQLQRYNERQIRRWKREYTAMEAAGLDTTESAAKISQWQERQRDFLCQTGLKRQYAREQVSGTGKTALQTTAGCDILVVKKTTTKAEANSVTQRVNAKGGIDRNYYGADGRQTIQISNHGHGHKKEEAMGNHGEHAHDYYWDSDGNMIRGKARELTEQERSDNSDFL